MSESKSLFIRWTPTASNPRSVNQSTRFRAQGLGLRVSRKDTAEELDSSYSWTVASARVARQQLPSKTLSL